MYDDAVAQATRIQYGGSVKPGNAAELGRLRLTMAEFFRVSGGSTQLRGVASITNGSVVQTRGLLFRDGSVFRLVASRIVGA